MRRGLAICAAVLLVGCSGGDHQAAQPAASPPGALPWTGPFTVSLAPADWSGWKDQAVQSQDVGQYLCAPSLCDDFPSGGHSLNYLVTARLPSLAAAHRIDVSFEIDEAPGTVLTYRFDPTNTCATPPSVHLMIGTTGSWLDANGATTESSRWWAIGSATEIKPGTYSISMPINPGTYSISMPINPAGFTDVLGKSGTVDPAGFASVLNTPEVGFTFGGGCYFGHGIGVETGHATFRLDSMVIR